MRRGEDGYAAAVGLTPVQALGERSSVGVRGAWEAYCSGRGIPNFVASLLREEVGKTELREIIGLTATDVFAVAVAGDRVARDSLDRIG